MFRGRDRHSSPFVLAVAAACVVAACAGPQLRPRAAPEAAACVALFDRVDAAVARERVGDAMAARIPGFPHLRVDRLLASFRNELRDRDAQRFWVERLAALDAEARAAELANLPGAALAALRIDATDATDATGETGETGETMGSDDIGRTAPPLSPRVVAELAAALGGCRDVLAEADFAETRRPEPQPAEADDAVQAGVAAATPLDTLRAAATVPDDYSLARRVVGLYPLTRVPFAVGVRAFEREIERVFALPLEALPRRGRLLRFAPAPVPVMDRAAAAGWIRDAAANPLHVPYLDAHSLRRLAERHAPVFEIDVATDDERIGTPVWPEHGPARIDVSDPQVFFRAAHTRAGDDVLLQLVYTAWFPARPPVRAFDLLAGHLDALVWRVTLAPDGEPLLFDSIHGCGCYHFFFPTPRLHLRPAPRTLEEWRFVPQTVPRPSAGAHVVLRVAAGTHYLQRVRYEADPRAAAAAIRYALVPDDTLRSLPRADGSRRSLYGPDGFVAGSERAERFVFWPMGIVKPGAMRQWGRHATAFVGRRHFDDPRLLDERFEIGE